MGGLAERWTGWGVRVDSVHCGDGTSVFVFFGDEEQQRLRGKQRTDVWNGSGRTDTEWGVVCCSVFVSSDVNRYFAFMSS